MNREKNIFLLIEACKKANFGLDLIGRGELKEDLEQYAWEMSADVRFPGVYPNSQLPTLIAKYPMFVLPSIWEGNPKSLLEAMSCGKAVIGTDVVGIREIIQDGVNGILCGNNAHEISRAILKLMDDSDLRSELGNNAREYILKYCGIPKIVDKELGVYESLVSK